MSRGTPMREFQRGWPSIFCRSDFSSLEALTFQSHFLNLVILCERNRYSLKNIPHFPQLQTITNGEHLRFSQKIWMENLCFILTMQTLVLDKRDSFRTHKISPRKKVCEIIRNNNFWSGLKGFHSKIAITFSNPHWKKYIRNISKSYSTLVKNDKSRNIYVLLFKILKNTCKVSNTQHKQ